MVRIVGLKSRPMKAGDLRRLIKAGRFTDSIAEVEMVE